jgi:hypothetical protein
MAQSVGYPLAAADRGGGRAVRGHRQLDLPASAVIAVAIVQLVLSLLAGRDRLTHQAEPDAASTKA